MRKIPERTEAPRRALRAMTGVDDAFVIHPHYNRTQRSRQATWLPAMREARRLAERAVAIGDYNSAGRWLDLYYSMRRRLRANGGRRR